MTIKYLIEGIVIFDVEKQSLTVQGNDKTEIVLHTPASNCLLLLLRHNDEIISQKFLFENAWENKGITVTPNALYQNITQIRKGLRAVGLSEDIIRTIPRVGFKCSADVSIITDEHNHTETTLHNNTTSPTGKNTTESAEVVDAVDMADTSDQAETLAPPPENQQNNAVIQSKGSDYINKNSVTLNKKRGYLMLRYYWWKILLIGYFVYAIPTLIYTNVFNLFNVGLFFHDYKKIDNINNCELYSSYHDKQASINSFTMLRKTNDLTCSSGKYAYITINREKKLSSILICNKPIEKNNTYCDLHINFGEPNEQ
ncbi:DNA-binding transcriptional activator CadC [compost metagenome]